MKILQVNAVYGFSSTGRTTKEMDNALKMKNCESLSAVINSNVVRDDIFIIGNKADRTVHSLCSRIFGLQGYFSHIPTMQLISYIKKENPDVVHLRNLHSNYINIPMLLRFLGKNDIPTVITLHDCFFYTGKCCLYLDVQCNKWENGCYSCPKKKKENISWFFDKSTKMYNDKKKLFAGIKRLGVVGVSDWTVDHAKRSLLKEAKIIKRIYNWIDLDTFAPRNTDNVKKILGLTDKFIILCAAQKWSRNKGIDVIKDLSELIPDNWVIIIVGDTPAGVIFNNKVLQAGVINDVKKLAEYYSLADVFISASVQETFGKTMAEALSCATPVVAYDAYSTSEIIGDEGKCGYIIKDNNAKNFLNKLTDVYKNTKSYYSTDCRARAESLFSMDKNIDEYISLYEELSEKKVL